MAKAKKKERSGPATRVHPELRQQGFLYRAGYGEIRWLHWDEQGLWVATRSALMLWDATSGALLKRLWTSIHGICRDGFGIFYTASQKVDCWDGELSHQRSFSGHRGRVEDVSVSPDGALIVSLGEDEQLLVCDSAGQELRRIAVGAGSRRLGVDWDSRKAWTSGECGAEQWDLQSGVRLQQAQRAPNQLHGKGWSVDDQGTLHFGDQPLEGLEEPVVAVVADPMQSRLAVASERELIVIDSLQGQTLQEWEDFLEWPLAVTISPDQRWVVSGGVEGQITVRHLLQGEIKQREPAHSDAITSLAFAGSGNALLSGCADGTICSWLWPTFELLHNLDGHDGPVQQLLVDSQRLFSAGADGQILIWDWQSGLLLGSLTGFEAALEELQLVQRGEILLALYDDGSWSSWDVSGYG
jgi:WD40 repeat protein